MIYDAEARLCLVGAWQPTQACLLACLLARSGEDACLPRVLLQATQSYSATRCSNQLIIAHQLGASSCRFNVLSRSPGNGLLLLTSQNYARPK